jgi:hypothetical protein
MKYADLPIMRYSHSLRKKDMSFLQKLEGRHTISCAALFYVSVAMLRMLVA